MHSLKPKILMAVDGSDQSLEAVEYAGREFATRHVKIVLFHVLSMIPEFFFDFKEPCGIGTLKSTTDGWAKRMKEEIVEFLSNARLRLIKTGVSSGDISIDIHNRKEGIARDILEESRNGYRALIIGRNGLNKIHDFVLGNAASKLLEKVTHIPLCLVGGKPLPGKVLLALDQSEGAMDAVQFTLDMFDVKTCEVTMFHAVRGFHMYQKKFGHIVSVDQEQEWMDAYQMESVFEQIRGLLLEGGLDPGRINSRIVKDVDSRAAAIIEEAEEKGLETIVMGRKGNTDISGFCIGRVGRKVVHMARNQAVWVVSEIR